MLAFPLLALALLQSAPPKDSLRVLDGARDAQARFERARGWSLPVSLGVGGLCEVRVGRYCYWYDEREPSPPDEPRIIGIQRERLLQDLTAAALVIPGDAWVTGQRVRYLIEHGDTAGAFGVAHACRSTAWWCAAVTGLVRHVAGDYGGADSAFSIALQEMDERRRCRWNDIRDLLESGVDGEYKRLSCTERDSANARLTWLGRTRFTVAGNPTWTEILSRRTYSTMLEDAITHHGARFGEDLAEIVLRYGWATAYSRRARAVTSSSRPSVIGHEPRPAYAFLPKKVNGDTAAEWVLRNPEARARLHTPWTSTVRWIEDIQWARFRRGDRSLVTATFVVSWDTLRVGRRGEATLVLSRGPWDEAPIPRTATTQEGYRGALIAETGPSSRFLASLEVEDTATGVVAMGRVLLEALPAPTTASRPVVSDVLLFRPGDHFPGSLSEAMRQAHHGITIPEHGRVGLYWEVYGLAETDSVGVSLAVEEQRPGFLRRVGRTLGVVGRPVPIRLSWQSLEGGGGAGVVAQAIELDLEPLGPGEYRIRIRLTGPSVEGLEVVRAIKVVSP